MAIKKRNAMVAGGAGAIGRTIARGMVKAGYTVTIVDVDGERAQRVAESTGASRSIGVDLTTERGVAAAVEAARDGGQLHAIVNAQGISPKRNGRQWPFHEISIEDWQHVLDVNLTGPFLLVKAAYKYLARHDGASIVNLVSIVAKTGVDINLPDGPGAHYCASKAGIQNLTMSLARELAPLGIRCNGVAPGTILSGMALADDKIVDDPADAESSDAIPLGRVGVPSDVAPAVLFLLSDDARYITGEVIDVDGGLMPD